MLNKINIKNVALIDSAEIDFIKGLNVLSGETGAGKSVIMESLNFVLGATADKSIIKSGESECFVSAEFDIEDNFAVKSILKEMDMEEDDTLILSRKMADTGKSSVKINGVSATVSMLKRLTGFLVDVHGQSEHFALLDERNQLDLIDKFGGEDIKAIKNKVKLCYEQLKELKKELLSNGGDEKDRIIKMDILNFQINEIQNAEVKEREYEELTELKTKLLNREKIINALSAVKNCISEEGGALDVISNAVRAINVISDINPKYENVSERLNSVYSELDDISDSVTELSDDFEDDGFSLEEVEDRLYKIKLRKSALKLIKISLKLCKTQNII